MNALSPQTTLAGHPQFRLLVRRQRAGTRHRYRGNAKLLHSHLQGLHDNRNHGNEILEGTLGADIICGMGGNDAVKAMGGNDTIDGMGGDDVLAAAAGRIR